MAEHWYKDAVIYQVHVRSFFDANDDGYGDFQGLLQKIPYLQELGVNTLWLLPFYRSPLRDDGYDISDFKEILPVHGTVDDFKEVLNEAHGRGLRIITELVLNHTSDQHPWFQEARQPGSPKRDWYVWSDTPEKYEEVRIIFKDTEHSNWSWDPVAGAYYWHRFFSHQPDLNWDNPAVEKAMHEVMFYWLDMGVDGLRLDAVPYLYEREGTSSENLPETLDAIKRLRRAMDERYGGEKVLLAEANQWPEDTLPYFGDGDGVQMAFNFPIMPRMYLALRRENRRPLVEMLHLTEDIPEDAQWAVFLRNHDELTLEMVTDEERDFMYNEYATDRQFRLNLGIRRRLAPLLGGDRRRIELMNALLMSLKGSPIMYYGDEIGMGDNMFLGDRNGVRTPMQWSSDRNAGFSRAAFHNLFLPTINEGRYSFRFVNVEESQKDPHSLYHFMRRLLAIRNRHGAIFGRGEMQILDVDNPSILAFTRSYDGQTVLVTANLSRFSQSFELPLQDFAGRTPVELFGRKPFPPIENGGAYRHALGPHGFTWFALPQAGFEQPSDARLPPVDMPETPFERPLPTLTMAGGLETMLVDTMLEGGARGRLEEFLPEWLRIQRWFGSKARPIGHVRLEDAVRLRAGASPVYLTTLRVAYDDGDVERYFLPIGTADRASANALVEQRPNAAIAWLDGPARDEQLLLCDATADPGFWIDLYDATRRGWKGRSVKGLYVAERTPEAELVPAEGAEIVGVEQSNSSAILTGAAFGKLYRKLSYGTNAEAEMLAYLTDAGFPFVPRMKGDLVYRRGELEVTLGIFQENLDGDGDAWSYTLREYGNYLERVGGEEAPGYEPPARYDEEIPVWLQDTAPEVLELAKLLGVRTAELHRTMAKATQPALAPEPTGQDELAALAARIRGEARQTQEQLGAAGHGLAPALFDRADTLLDTLAELPGGWAKIRIHGDYHLGQVLQAKSEFYLLDFEGEPARPAEERRTKEQALRDVAGMLRSFDYAGLVSVRDGDAAGSRAQWGHLLTRWAEAAYLEAYLSTAGDDAAFLPDDPATRDLVLWAYTFDKVLYEVRYELGSRPAWVELPLNGLERLLRAS